MTAHYLEYPYNLINSYSWKDIDDLGQYYACTHELEGIAQYYSLNINVTSIPFYVRAGMCMPVQCTQGMMNEVSKRLMIAFDSLLSFLGSFKELAIIDKYNIRIGFNFVAPREGLNNIRVGKVFPAIFITCAFFVYLLLCIVATILHTYKDYLPERLLKQGNVS